MRLTCCLVVIACRLAAVRGEEVSGARWIDLTHPFNERTIYWPTEKGFLLDRGASGVTARGYYYSANRFTAAEHGGTHLDAPIHFHADRLTVDQIGIDRLVGDAAVVDVAAACATNATYEVTADDLVAWEDRHRRRLSDVLVLLRTGHGRHWQDRSRYLGTDASGAGAVEHLRFPGLSPDAAKWLVTERRPKAVGIDTASIDHGPSKHFGSHVALCGANVPIFENLAALDALPEWGAFVVALPMKISGGSGGPLRIVARLVDQVGDAGPSPRE